MNDEPRTFRLVRTEDVSGVSGVGAVAEGVTFTDGTTVLRWLRAGGSTAVYDSHERMAAIHGHDGRTTVQWAADRAEPVLDMRRVVLAITNVATRHGVVKDPPIPLSLMRIYGYTTYLADMDAEIAAEYEKLGSEAQTDGR